jgi:hypothetical protein
MAVETATRIHQLNTSSPPSSDPAVEGAAQLRTIKAAVKGSFPNFGTSTDSGVVTLTADQINALASITAAVPVNIRNAATTLDADYANGVVYKNNGTAYTYTLSNSVPVGTQFLVQNVGSAGNLTIDVGGQALRWLRGNNAAPGTGNRTISPAGSALVTKIASGEFHLVGTGIA